jgi:hypothetical protein
MRAHKDTNNKIARISNILSISVFFNIFFILLIFIFLSGFDSNRIPTSFHWSGEWRQRAKSLVTAWNRSRSFIIDSKTVTLRSLFLLTHFISMKWSTKIRARRLFPHDPKDVQVLVFVTWTTLWSWELTSVLLSRAHCWFESTVNEEEERHIFILFNWDFHYEESLHESILKTVDSS